MRWDIGGMFVLLAIITITACASPAAQPLQPVSDQDTITPAPSLRSWWQDATRQTGGVLGRATLANGRPVINAAIFPKPIATVGGEINLIGILTNQQGAFRFGGPAGIWEIQVRDSEGRIIGSQQVEIIARQTVTVQIVVELPCVFPPHIPMFGAYVVCETGAP